MCPTVSKAEGTITPSGSKASKICKACIKGEKVENEHEGYKNPESKKKKKNIYSLMKERSRDR